MFQVFLCLNNNADLHPVVNFPKKDVFKKSQVPIKLETIIVQPVFSMKMESDVCGPMLTKIISTNVIC